MPVLIATAKIKSIKSQHILSNEDYGWLLEHLNEELPLLSINFMRDSKLFSFAIYKGPYGCITLFLPENTEDYELRINGIQLVVTEGSK